MSDMHPGTTFRQSKRGYDPDQVHARIDELTQQLAEARDQAEAARRRGEESEQLVEQLRAQVRELERSDARANYETVAQRVQGILVAADDAASELRARAEGDAADTVRQAESRAARTVTDARAEADALVERARRQANEAIADSERQVAILGAEISELEAQRDHVLTALGALRESLTHAAQDLVTSTQPEGPQSAADSAVASAEQIDDDCEPALATG